MSGRADERGADGPFDQVNELQSSKYGFKSLTIVRQAGGQADGRASDGWTSCCQALVIDEGEKVAADTDVQGEEAPPWATRCTKRCARGANRPASCNRENGPAGTHTYASLVIDCSRSCSWFRVPVTNGPRPSHIPHPRPSHPTFRGPQRPLTFSHPLEKRPLDNDLHKL